MKINQKIKTWLPWVWCIDIFFYAMAFPVIICVVNKKLDVLQYTVPSLIFSACGGLLNLKITEKTTMKYLYENWFWQITILDAFIWLTYFSLWIAGIIPDKAYPIMAAVMHVSTVELSKTVRMEFENRLFPVSEDKTEFGNACGIIMNLYNSIACIILIVSCLKSMLFGQLLLMFAMVVDNAIFLWLWRRFETGRLLMKS